MHLQYLVIEATRRCQLTCAHCNRGDQQYINMKREYLEEFLAPVTSIYRVTFSGGEPFLNPDCIKDFIEICKANGIKVQDFFIATNGVVFNYDNPLSRLGLEQIEALTELCEQPPMGVEISKTQFHGDHLTSDNLLTNVLNLKVIEQVIEQEFIIMQGRALENDLGGRFIEEKTTLDPTVHEEALFYFNCKGKFLLECDYSFDVQDRIGMSIQEAHQFIQQYYYGVNGL